MRNKIVATMAVLSIISVNSSAGPMKITPTGVTFSDNSTLTSATSGGGDGHSLDAADGSPVDSVFVDNNGNVGIGNSSPSATLHVNGTGILVENLDTTSTGTTFAINAISNNPKGIGILVDNRATSGGTGRAIYARSYSSNGRGIVGEASASSGNTYGIYGTSQSPDGTGVYGVGNNLSGLTYGVYGLAKSATGVGVKGKAQKTSGINFGVYGETNSSVGYGVYSQGNAKVVGDLTVTGGISGDGSQLLNLPTASISADSISTDEIINGTITSLDVSSISASKITGLGDLAISDSVGTTMLQNGAVTAAKISGGSGSGVDADLLDGQDSSHFATTNHLHAGTYAAVNHAHNSTYAALTHDHNSTYLSKAGGSMTGGLTLQTNGLIVGTDQLVTSGGNVGIGTANPGANLDVAGSSKLGVSGTVMTNVQSGTFVLGSGTPSTSFTVTFPHTFSSTPNQILVTTKNGGNLAIFAVSTRNISTTSFDVRVYRVNSANGEWTTNPSLDWLAIE